MMSQFHFRMESRVSQKYLHTSTDSSINHNDLKVGGSNPGVGARSIQACMCVCAHVYMHVHIRILFSLKKETQAHGTTLR